MRDKLNKFYSFSFCCLYNRAGGNGPAAPVLARPVFLKLKMKFNFYKKQVINKSACVIVGLVKPVIIKL